MFHQIEGICVDKNIDFSNLKYLIYKIIYNLFGKDIKIKLRPSYFPFTEPSAEVDILSNDGKWLEVLGCGIVNPVVLENCKIDSNIIEYICDTTKEKIGKYSPGMHIPIVNVEDFRKDNAEIVYLFAWNHKDEILKKESVFTEKKREWISHVKI